MSKPTTFLLHVNSHAASTITPLTCTTTQSPLLSPHNVSTRRRPRPTAPPARRRLYATLSSSAPDHPSSQHPSPAPPPPPPPPLLWPTLPPHQAHPTPYQIFCQSTQTPYSKQRFYELVKLYHPDRDGHPNHSSHAASPCACTRPEMLERYRLIVAANTILSDPRKRDAYNRFGHGWDLPDAAHPADATAAATAAAWQYTTTHRWRSGSTARRQWPAGHDPMYNATWEDWERWYARGEARTTGAGRRWGDPYSFFSSSSSARGQQGTIFASNYTFISVIFLLAALGGVGQATRANDFAARKLEQARGVNEESSRILMQTRLDTKDAGEGKDARIRRFLRDKEAYGEGEFDARALRADDEGLCAPGLVGDRDARRFWEKPPENR